MKRMLVAVLVLIGLAHPSAAGRPAQQQVIDRYSYDGSGNAAMTTSGTITMGVGAVLAMVSVDVTDRAHPFTYFADVVDLSSRDGVRGFGAASGVRLCSAPLTCEVQGNQFRFGVASAVSGDGQHRLHLRYYLVARGPRVSMSRPSLAGWTASRRTSGLVTRTDADAGGGGVTAENVDAGLNTGVTAAGPVGGSVAIAVPACDVTGAGVLVLSGGQQPTSALCPSGPVGGVSAHRTTWAATGAVAGVSLNQTRLVVIPR